MFAGGLDFNNSLSSSTVDIYDATAGSWTTARLSEPRYSPSAAAAGGKILIAGGVDNISPVDSSSATVDIYDAASGAWSTARLSEARGDAAAAGLGNKILFGGGVNLKTSSSKTVDIYDVPSNTWTTAQLSEPRWYLAAAAAGTKVLFAGGTDTTVSNTVDIYDVSTGAWSTAKLSEARLALTGAAAGNKIVFAGGNSVIALPGGQVVDNGVTDTVDVYDAAANSWAIMRLSQAREALAATAAGNKLLFAGGAIPTNPGNTSIFYTAIATVDIFTVSGQ
jgi:hypothetical protein